MQFSYVNLDMQGVAVAKRLQSTTLVAPVRAITRIVHKSLPAKKVMQVAAILANRTGAGESLLIYIYNFHVLNHLLLVYICKLH